MAFACYLCGWPFKTNWDLERHTAARHTNITHPCQHCKKSYTRNHRLRDHLKKAHPTAGADNPTKKRPTPLKPDYKEPLDKRPRPSPEPTSTPQPPTVLLIGDELTIINQEDDLSSPPWMNWRLPRQRSPDWHQLNHGYESVLEDVLTQKIDPTRFTTPLTPTGPNDPNGLLELLGIDDTWERANCGMLAEVTQDTQLSGLITELGVCLM